MAIKKNDLNMQNNIKNWAQEMFNQVLYTDESKFEIFGTKRCQYVRRRIGEAYQPECIKHGGGSLQVWGCLSSSGVGDLIKIEG